MPRRALGRVRHTAGTVALLARDRRAPRPIRWLLVIALLPIPGPFEEIAGGIALAYVARRLPDVWAEHHHRDLGGEAEPTSS